MRIDARSMATLFVGGLLAAPAFASVNVSFVKPESFSDVKDRVTDRDEALKQIEQHFRKLGRKYLGEGQMLTIEVLDIDRAGRTHAPSRLFKDPDVRVVSDRGGDAPRIRFRYRIDAPGRRPVTGEERLVDGTYLSRFNPYPSSDPLKYEKLMLDDWFKRRFGEAGRSAH